MNEAVFDSPNDWVAEHTRRFVDTGGRPRPGMNDLLLTTRGRTSGKLRRTVLMFVPHGEGYVVTASNGGSDQHPGWYLNIVDDPRVTVQIGTETFAATARTATAIERAPLWRLLVAAMPSYQRYAEATGRDIPVVIIERAR